MKKKSIPHPISIIAIAIGLMIAIGYVSSLIYKIENKETDKRVFYEQLEYHSQDGSHVVEIDGYIRIIRQ